MASNIANLRLPTKACHNCRRRRWKCDRSLPVCQKCLSAGTECLGYGKLFVWNEGVASRGKMMGKTYEERIAAKNGSRETTPLLEKQHPVRIQEHHFEQEQGQENIHEREEEHEQGATVNAEQTQPTNEVAIRDKMETVVHWALNDPLVQDLNPHSRYYLYHFASQLCVDMVVYDEPGQNPMRDLIPATSAYPLLLQIILANSAHHVFNISREPMDGSVYQPDQRPCLTAYYKAVTRFGGPLKSSLRDALIAKSSALSLLAQSVANVNESNIDLILATILLFVNYDLIESGKDKWKVHMEGARRLIDLLGTPAYQPREMTRLRKCLLADFIVFYILGSTFSFTFTPKFLPDTIDIEPILQYAETNNYLSCPAPLLRIMLQSFELPDTRGLASSPLHDQIQEKVRQLLEAAISFDPVQWSCNFMPASPFEDLDKRVRIASAHRSAVCIYIARVLPCTNPLLDPDSGSALVSLTALADDIVHHVSHLNPGDTLFKSISWPLFLAGAESEDPTQRTWILDMLDAFYRVMYWGYVPTVKKVLETIWLCKDLASDGGANCWVWQVKDIGLEILIA
ncbi:fungal-specific transcription factor domain-containing protein [Dendryphion nanum]|uniref:Fungal-specific transcription factor domain-containing protein n=1 Tax=Dendryphion nanum TaxID=256645 RepID=A0A9P9EE62_9PLEO|nr:fungal-specific transcription factor domain-containing protein [Dendryphion nanum]